MSCILCDTSGVYEGWLMYVYCVCVCDLGSIFVGREDSDRGSREQKDS